MKKNFFLLGFMLLCMVVALVFLNIPGISAKDAQITSADLFTDSPIVGELDRSDEPTIVRTRFVNVNFDLLAGADVGVYIPLNLFTDVSFDAVFDRVKPNPSGGISLIGRLVGEEYGQVILVAKDNVLVGNITLHDKFFQVRYAGGGVHAVYQIDQSAFPPELDPIPVYLSDDETYDIPMADDGSIIDVLVVYTGTARAAAGGTTAMNNLINLAVSETNTGYSNSGANQRVNLVHTAEVTYTETGDMYTDLPRLQNPSDGYMDNVHSLRNTYCADEIVLIIANGGAYCGLAYMMTTVSSTFESWAFAVVDDGCATGYYSFAHEMGHNMAAAHDWYVDSSSSSPYSYNHGYVNSANSWRTIMAYNSECSDGGGYCFRLNYWSNPYVTYGGNPMGVPQGTSTSCITGVPNPNCDADNRLTLNNTALTVANFRQSCTEDRYLTWTRESNGRISNWTFDSSGGFVSAMGYGATGWIATSYFRNSDGTGHMLLTRPAGGQAFLWNLNASGAISGGRGYWVPGWWATSYFRNSDGTAYLLLTKSGQAVVWNLNASGNVVGGRGYSASGFTAQSYHRNSDGTAHLLLTKSGQAVVWNLNASGNVVGGRGYSASGFTAQSYHRNSDGTAHLLWTRSSDGRAVVWNLNASGNTVGGKGYNASGWIATSFYR